MNKPIVSQIFNAEPSLGNPSVDNYVLSSTTAGVRSWVASGSGGTTPSDGLLHWDTVTNSYQPYTTQTIGKFDSTSTTPIHTTRLNYDGILYATEFIATSGVIDDTIQGYSNGGYAGLYGHNYTSGYGIVGYSEEGVAIIANSNTGTPLVANNFSNSNTSDIFKCQLSTIDKFIIDKDGLPKSVALAGVGDRIVGVDSTGKFKIVTVDLSGKEDNITAGTTSQYWRGDKSFQDLNKTAVGLSNVDNTSDLNKPISTATQSALDLKENDLGNPSNDGYILSSTTSGTRSWISSSGGVTPTNKLFKWVGSYYDAYDSDSEISNDAGFFKTFVSYNVGAYLDSNTINYNGGLSTNTYNTPSFSASSRFSTAINAISNTGAGIDTISSTNYGIRAQSTSSFGAIITSVNSTPLVVNTTNLSNSSDLIKVRHYNSDIIVFKSTGDIELIGASKGIILKSPNGTRYKLTVSNTGSIVVTAV